MYLPAFSPPPTPRWTDGPSREDWRRHSYLVVGAHPTAVCGSPAVMESGGILLSSVSGGQGASRPCTPTWHAEALGISYSLFQTQSPHNNTLHQLVIRKKEKSPIYYLQDYCKNDTCTYAQIMWVGRQQGVDSRFTFFLRWLEDFAQSFRL